MATASPDRFPPADSLPAELVDGVAAEAAEDADRVALFLRYLGLVPAPEAPVRLDAAFLLELGAALRLLKWEGAGLTIHREAGLPAAQDALERALLTVASEGTIPEDRQLSRRVLKLFVERFAWHGRRDLGAAVTVDDLDEDAALDALAELLWANRQRGRDQEEG